MFCDGSSWLSAALVYALVADLCPDSAPIVPFRNLLSLVSFAAVGRLESNLGLNYAGEKVRHLLQ